MEEHRKEIRISPIVYRIHVLIYVLIIGYLAQLIWVATGTTYGLAIAAISILGGMLVFETITFQNNSNLLLKFRRAYYTYKSFQIFVSISMIVWFPIGICFGIGTVMTVMFIMELLYMLEFEDIMTRIIFYIVTITFLVIYSLFGTLILPDMTLQEQFRRIAVDATIGLFIILLGEIVSRIWVHFDGMILSQHRMMDRLNDANAELQEHQEKISKVNEILAFQKFQLQRANDKIKAAHEEMIVQNEIANVISSSLDFERLMQSIGELIMNQMNMDAVAIIVEPEERTENSFTDSVRTLHIFTQLGEKFEAYFRDVVKAGIMDTALRSRSSFICNSDEVKRLLGEDCLIKSAIVIPMLKNRQRIGNLLVANCNENIFSDNREFYETIAGQISIGITNSMLYRQMKEMAIRDGLTGIYNRRYLTDMLHEQLKDAIQKKMPVSLALFDIDKFKMVNDTFGHLFGDTVIKYVARLLQECAMRNGGMAGRYGGEEFVLVFPDKSIDVTYEIVSKLHKQIKSRELEHEGKKLIVKVSCGIASYPQTCQNPSDVLTRADWAMYHSKRNGRDQITIDNENITAIM